jgi:hypothetical protein
MSEIELHKEVIEDGTSTKRADNTKNEAVPLVFHRVRCCPACGEDGLSHCDFGVFHRSQFFGMTSDGHKGCGRVDDDGDDELAISCRECGYEFHNASSSTDEQLMERVVAEGQEIQVMNFSCPVCQSTRLYEHETGIEFVQEVRAVYTIPGDNDEEEQAEIALAPIRYTRYSANLTYRCLNDHELANDDGSPVETAKQLVAWLKARVVHEKKNEPPRRDRR